VRALWDGGIRPNAPRRRSRGRPPRLHAQSLTCCNAPLRRGYHVDDLRRRRWLKGGFQNQLDVYDGWCDRADDVANPSWDGSRSAWYLVVPWLPKIKYKRRSTHTISATISRRRGTKRSVVATAVVEEEEDQLALEQRLYEESLKVLDEGQVLVGVIVAKYQDELLVDIGGKSEGILPFRELSLIIEPKNSASAINSK